MKKLIAHLLLVAALAVPSAHAVLVNFSNPAPGTIYANQFHPTFAAVPISDTAGISLELLGAVGTVGRVDGPGDDVIYDLVPDQTYRVFRLIEVPGLGFVRAEVSRVTITAGGLITYLPLPQ